MGEIIHRLYKRNALHHLLYGWVKGQQRALPSLSNEKSIDLFFDYFKIDEKEFTKINARTVISRMNEELIESEKNRV